MKKFLLGVIAAVCVAFGASAQRTELQIGYGGYTQMDATDMHNGGKVKNAWGALTAGVNFKLAPKFWFGPSYSFSSSSSKVFYHVFMLNGRYEYFRNSIVKLYGHMGLGVDVSHISFGGFKDNKGYFAYQFSPIGAQADIARGISLFGELGFGAQGLLQVGVRFGI